VRRILDLTLPLESTMRGVDIEPVKTLHSDGWNASRLSLYSHCGTHMDAPRHFLPGGATIDRQPLEACIGPARCVDLTPVEPRQRMTVACLEPWADRIKPGDRLLLRTDWSQCHGTADYRDALPRIDAALARWFVERGIVLLGVEPPSVADVHNRDELTTVHRILLEGGVTIVEGLNGLDQITTETVQLIVLPLRVMDGDGSPVRAVAIEQTEDS
jgi:kynurenine formamidase